MTYSEIVRDVVQRFSTHGENPDELFRVGCVGLIKALYNFDQKCEVQFSTYAVPMIIGEIRRYLREKKALTEAATCQSCTHFRGLGDWSLCCDIKYDLCYEDSPACRDYAAKEKAPAGRQPEASAQLKDQVQDNPETGRKVKAKEMEKE